MEDGRLIFSPSSFIPAKRKKTLMDFTMIDWGIVVAAGLVATAIMTMLAYGAPIMGMPKIDIAQMMGSVVLPLGNTAFATGMLIHFVMGVIFAIIYALVWQGLGIIPSWWTGLIFGAVHFLAAAMGMGVMSVTNPEMNSGRLYNPMNGGLTGMSMLLMGHLIFWRCGSPYLPAFRSIDKGRDGGRVFGLSF
jgi:hypothetical protein